MTSSPLTVALRPQHAVLAALLGLSYAPLAETMPPPPLPDQQAMENAPVTIVVEPLLGKSSPASDGLTSYVVKLENRTTLPQRGTLYLAPTRGLYRSADVGDALSRSEVVVPAAGRTTVEMLAVGPRGAGVDALLEDEQGRRLGLGRGYATAGAAAHVFAVAHGSRVPALLDGKPLPELVTATATGFPPPHGYSDPQQVLGSTALLDDASGQAILPTRAAGYAPTTLVVCRSADFVALPPTQMAALAGWVLGGGTLAVVVTRDADLAHPMVTRLLGGDTGHGAPPAALLDPLPLRIASTPAPAAGQAVEHVTVEVDTTQRALLRGYTGGNLKPSPWGASASYGTGEITLLGFDPNQKVFAASQWTELKLLDLVGHAHDRKANLGVAIGAAPADDHRTYAARRFLRRNSNQHWAISGAALVLIAYAVVAGPINFGRSRSKRRPLLALPAMFTMSLLTLLIVLCIGALNRGTGRRARHLALIDAAAGMPRAATTRFRAFHSSSYEGLVVTPKERGGVLTLSTDDDDLGSQMQLSREGVALHSFVAKPWQTVHVKEEGLTSIGGGVALFMDDSQRLWVHNRTGRELAAAVLRDQRGSWAYFESIEDGARLTFDSGRPLTAASGWAGALPLLPPPVEDWMDETAPGAGQAWNAFEALRQGDTTWWPDGVPALLAQVVGGAGRLDDSGFQLDSDRTLLRVVGFGGRP